MAMNPCAPQVSFEGTVQELPQAAVHWAQRFSFRFALFRRNWGCSGFLHRARHLHQRIHASCRARKRNALFSIHAKLHAIRLPQKPDNSLSSNAAPTPSSILALLKLGPQATRREWPQAHPKGLHLAAHKIAISQVFSPSCRVATPGTSTGRRIRTTTRT